MEFLEDAAMDSDAARPDCADFGDTFPLLGEVSTFVVNGKVKTSVPVHQHRTADHVPGAQVFRELEESERGEHIVIDHDQRVMWTNQEVASDAVSHVTRPHRASSEHRRGETGAGVADRDELLNGAVIDMPAGGGGDQRAQRSSGGCSTLSGMASPYATKSRSARSRTPRPHTGCTVSWTRSSSLISPSA